MKGPEGWAWPLPDKGMWILTQSVRGLSPAKSALQVPGTSPITRNSRSVSGPYWHPRLSCGSHISAPVLGPCLGLCVEVSECVRVYVCVCDLCANVLAVFM